MLFYSMWDDRQDPFEYYAEREDLARFILTYCKFQEIQLSTEIKMKYATEFDETFSRLRSSTVFDTIEQLELEKEREEERLQRLLKRFSDDAILIKEIEENYNKWQVRYEEEIDDYNKAMLNFDEMRKRAKQLVAKNEMQSFFLKAFDIYIADQCYQWKPKAVERQTLEDKRREVAEKIADVTKRINNLNFKIQFSHNETFFKEIDEEWFDKIN